MHVGKNSVVGVRDKFTYFTALLEIWKNSKTAKHVIQKTAKYVAQQCRNKSK